MDNKFEPKLLYEKIQSPRILEGIEPEFIIPEYKFIIEEFICTICSNLVFNPTTCEYCDNCFCKTCISRWLANNKRCPNLCEVFIHSKMRRVPANILNKIRLFCRYKNQGCVEVVNYENYFNHIDNCDYVLCKCLSPGCEFKDIQKNMILHLLSCPLLYDTCMYCKAKMKKSVLDFHLVNCPERKEECPICKKEILMKDLSYHKKKCVRYSCFSCKDNLSKEEFDSHKKCSELIRAGYEEKIISLLQRIEELEKKNKSIVTEISDLKKQPKVDNFQNEEEVKADFVNPFKDLIKLDSEAKLSLDLDIKKEESILENKIKISKNQVKIKNNKKQKNKHSNDIEEDVQTKHYDNINSHFSLLSPDKIGQTNLSNCKVSALTINTEKKLHNKTIFSIVNYNSKPKMLAVASCDRKISLVNLDSQTFSGYLNGHQSAVTCLLVMPSSKGQILLSSGGDKQICIWDLKAKSLLATLEGHSEWVEKLVSLDSVNKNWFASCGWDYKVLIWDLENRTIVHQFSEHQGMITSLLAMPLYDENHTKYSTCLVSASNCTYDKGVIFVWDLNNLTLKHKLSNSLCNSVKNIESVQGTNYIISSCEKVAFVWDVSTGEVVRIFNGHSSNISCLSYYKIKEQILILTGSAYPEIKLEIWDLNTGCSLNSIMKLHKKSIKKLLDFSEFTQVEGTFITGGEDGVVNIINIYTSEIFKTFTAFNKCITTLEIIDHKYIAVGANDGSLEIFKIEI